MKGTTRTLMLASAIACYVLPAMTQAQNMPRGPMTFSTFDGNGDGVVTAQEFDAARAERWSAMAAAGAPMRGMANAPSFADFDANGDGRMTTDEFTAGHQARMRNGPGMGMGPGYGRGQGGGMGRGMGMGRNMPAFSEFDLDGNGSLSEQEFYEARAQRIAERSQQGYQMRGLANAPEFKTIDLNQDGKVDAQEFATAQAQHHQQMMPPGMMPPTR